MVFYQARQKTRELQLEQFVEAAANTFPSIEDIRPDWERLFRYLGDQNTIVVLDEFPYLIEQDESLRPCYSSPNRTSTTYLYTSHVERDKH